MILTELPDSAPSCKARGGVSHAWKSRSWALVLPRPSATGDGQPWGEHEGAESLGIFQLFIWARWCPCPRAVCEGGRCQLSAAKHTYGSRVWKRMRGDLDGAPTVITTRAMQSYRISSVKWCHSELPNTAVLKNKRRRGEKVFFKAFI